MVYTNRNKIFDVINIIITGLIALVCVYPMYYVLMASFSIPSELMRHTGLFASSDGIYIRGI